MNTNDRQTDSVINQSSIKDFVSRCDTTTQNVFNHLIQSQDKYCIGLLDKMMPVIKQLLSRTSIKLEPTPNWFPVLCESLETQELVTILKAEIDKESRSLKAKITGFFFGNTLSEWLGNITGLDLSTKDKAQQDSIELALYLAAMYLELGKV